MVESGLSGSGHSDGISGRLFIQRATAATRPNFGHSERFMSILKPAVRSGSGWMAEFGTFLSFQCQPLNDRLSQKPLFIRGVLNDCVCGRRGRSELSGLSYVSRR